MKRVSLVAGLVVMLVLAAGARSQGLLTVCKSNLKNMATALEMWSDDHQGHFPQSLSQLTPNYLKVLPLCPVAKRDTYSENYRSAPDRFALCCAGLNHSASNSPLNFPAYTSSEGLVERKGLDELNDPLDCQSRQARLADALRSYKSATGAYPGSLAELVPGTLEELPEFPHEQHGSAPRLLRPVLWRHRPSGPESAPFPTGLRLAHRALPTGIETCHPAGG